MKVYRLTKSNYKEDLEGTGAKLYGGRWNHVGTPCIYTAESRALAVLEYSANVELDLLPTSLHMTCYEIPDTEFIIIEEKDLPKDWKAVPSSSSTHEFGSSYLRDPSILGIRVPSTLVPDEFNFIINPEADHIKKIQVVSATEFLFDTRIKS